MGMDGIAVGDFQGLQHLRKQAQEDARKALPEVTKQFEAIFLQSMLKSMRLGQQFLDESSPFKGKYQETFQDMLDGQYASNVANGKGIGLAEMLARQLSQTTNKVSGVSKSGATESMALIRPEQAQTKLHLSPRLPRPEGDTEHQVVDDFVKSILPYARQAARILGLDPKLLIAQAALETGWGQYIAKDADGSSSHNLFNIKHTGKTGNDAVEVRTTEYVANTPIKTRASFKKYDSVAESFSDYIALLKNNGRYEQALANTGDPHRFVTSLHQAGYATDPLYANKVMSIYQGEELEQALSRNGYIIK
ncbi:flagellar assembly peptidoglycan hydrolase FlgJ [Legionella spiritensis]|uniref:flagellar assembly peptidoglycan hydrolase FlgJ n=1 Tax=Legionella spiritensis TaxID=452 RepID=UPI000F705E11|nr:flagellar assembly peptidoglycan hydrolase FlgJ [Legionella spiritensis]VEG89770.1 muramidase, peptidoglycan hydrolase FlgJ [Legionella spiritensis]